MVIALAGSNGAGKTTFFHAHLAQSGLRFVNADELSAQLELGAYEAAEAATAIRSALYQQGESFIFETVLSDPVGAKIDELVQAAAAGYETVLLFIQIDSAETSIQRVAMRVAQGGHDVPNDKLLSRFARTRSNLERAIKHLRWVLVYDNSDLRNPFRHLATFHNGERVVGETDS